MLKEMYEQYSRETKDTPLSFEEFADKVTMLLTYIINLIKKKPEEDGGSIQVSDKCYMYAWSYNEGIKLAFGEKSYAKIDSTSKANCLELF